MINPQKVREHCAGYVGGETIAKKATDEEIIYLVESQDEITKLFNKRIAQKHQND